MPRGFHITSLAFGMGRTPMMDFPDPLYAGYTVNLFEEAEGQCFQIVDPGAFDAYIPVFQFLKLTTNN